MYLREKGILRAIKIGNSFLYHDDDIKEYKKFIHKNLENSWAFLGMETPYYWSLISIYTFFERRFSLDKTTNKEDEQFFYVLFQNGRFTS